MLQSMRRFSKSWFSTALLSVLALAFVIWGVGPNLTGPTSTWVARVGGRCTLLIVWCDPRTTIEQPTFQREYRNDTRRASNAQLTPEQVWKFVNPNRTLDRMIADAAMSNYAGDFGLTVSDDTVSRAIHGIEGFRGLTGTFDKAVYQQRINDFGYTDAQFTAVIRNEIRSNQVRAVAEAGLTAPIGYLAALAGFISEVRTADYVVLTPAMLGPVAPPSDAVLAAYVKAHAERFSTPEYRSLTYAVIGPEDVAGSLKVTDKQLHEAYDQHRAEYNAPETREADEISFLTRAEAEAARARLKTAADYDALATARKLTPKTLSIGVVAKDQIEEKDRADAIFSLKPGEISQPVKGPFGYVLVRLRKINPALFKTFDSVKPDLETEVKAKLAKAALDEVMNKFKNAQDAGAEIVEAGRQTGMRIVTVPAVDAHGLAPDGRKANVGGKEFLDHVFGAEIGEDGDPFTTSDGHNYVLKVSGSVPPKPKSLDNVRAQALEAWMREARTKLLQKKAQALALQANQDGNLSRVASALGTTVQSSGRLDRAPKGDVFAPEVLRALFARPAGIAVSGPLAKGEGYVIARTTGVSHARITQGDQNFERLKYEISSAIGADLSAALANAEKSRQGVRVDQKMFDQVVGGETG